MIPPSSQELYWMKFIIWRHLLEPFFYNSVIISQEHLNQSICVYHCVYLTSLVSTIDIITSALSLIGKKLNDMCICRKPCSFKGPYSFHKTSCSNICLKIAVLNVQKYLQPPHSLLVNVLICNFTTVITAVH